VLRGLDVLDGGVLVEVALVVNVELAEGILQREDVASLELRVFPWTKVSNAVGRRVYILLELDDIHDDGRGWLAEQTRPVWFGSDLSKMEAL
jgi:hypothetical protein